MTAVSKGSVIAIDHGTKRTGFAVVDPLRIISQPLDVWEGPGDADELLEYIASLVEERRVEAFVVGDPLGPDGKRGPRAQDVAHFAERLARRFPELSVISHDERLSTKAAEDMLREAGLHGAKRKSRRDSWSALVILRDWLRADEPR